MTTEDHLKNLKLEAIKTDVEIKKVELAIKQKNLNSINQSKRKITFERGTIVVAIIGLIGSFIANAVQGFFSEKQKKQEFESALIIKAVENWDSSISRRNLNFLLKAGLITDKDGKISSIIADTTSLLPEFNNSKVLLNNDYVFINPGGLKYHLPNCRIVLNSAERVTRNEARELELLPCKICHSYKTSEDSARAVQCQGVTKKGNRCKHNTRSVNGFCALHQP